MPGKHANIFYVVKRHGAMAQSVEHIVHIDGVVGSSPTGTTTKTTTLHGWLFFCVCPEVSRLRPLRGERTSMGHFPLRRLWRKQQGEMLLTERSETVGSSPTGTTTKK